MFFSRKVKVTFVDGSSKRTLGTVEMAPEQLPESFLLDTTMDMAGRKWSVERAEPATRQEYTKTRKLVLTLAEIRAAPADIGDILFSLPTINDDLPNEDVAADGSEVVLAEDDWRQTEFVASSHAAVVGGEIRAIQRIHAEHRRGVGFDQVHVRTKIAAPLTGTVLKIDAIRDLPLELTECPRFDRHGRRILGGFALGSATQGHLYGIQEHGQVVVLATHRLNHDSSGRLASALETLAQRHDLLLVDWCRCIVGAPGDPLFRLAVNKAG